MYQHTGCSTKRNTSCNNHRRHKNHNDPLLFLFSTPQPVANHLKGKNKHKMLKKSAAVQLVGGEVSRKRIGITGDQHVLHPSTLWGTEMVEVMPCRWWWCRVRQSITPHQNVGEREGYGLLHNLELRKSTVTWPVTSKYVQEHILTRVQSSGPVHTELWQEGQGA